MCCPAAGPGGASELKRWIRGLLRRARALVQKYPYRIQCNACGWRGRVFSSDAWHPHTVCPICGSQVRHRLLLAALAGPGRFGIPAIVTGKRVLHFAPEKVLAGLLRESAGRYVTADYFKKKVDMRLDMCEMPAISDGSFDLIVACDVLEHVADDSAALREVHRALAASGWAIFTVPQKDRLPAKLEDPGMVTPEQREAAFGQADHLRIYGDDFDRFLEKHGFAVAVVDESSFDPATVRRNVLFPPILSARPLATNHRKIFFAQKRSG